MIQAAAALDGLTGTLAGLASRAADRQRPTLVSATIPLDGAVDPSAIVLANRAASERWFCWEQPDAGFALAGLGAAAEVVSRGPDRFADVVAATARITRDRLDAGEEGLPAGAGPVWTGGFAFDPDGGREAHWSSFSPALLTMPEISICATPAGAWLTIAAIVSADNPGIERPMARVRALDARTLPLLDPDPAGSVAVRSALPPSHFEEAVASAVTAIRAGEAAKIVLAREVRAEAPRAHDPAPLFGALRELFPSCYCFCAGSPEGAFIGASPELLVRRRGAGLQTVALAGSTRRSADPAVDDHLGEQLRSSAKNRQEHAIVVRRIERALRPLSVWVEAGGEPELIKVANIQHLGTPVHAQLADPRSAVELAGLLHPTPAVGGEPREAALAAIAELEGMDRGWYAGPVGWMDAIEDGEFCVALRSALLRDRTAHLFAGGGIVADSDPAEELAETELKLGALLPLIAS